MAETLIEAERIVPGDLTTITPGHILVRDGVIAAVGAGSPPRRPDVRLDSGVLVPGFVDLQVNGYFGAELEAVRPDEWRMIAARLPGTGTTAFMPTTGIVSASSPRTTCVQNSVIARIKT